MPGFKDEPPAEVPDLVVEPPSTPRRSQHSARAESGPLELDLGSLGSPLSTPKAPSSDVPTPGAVPSFGGLELSAELDFFETEGGPGLDLGWELEAVGPSAAAPPAPGRLSHGAPSHGSTPHGGPASIESAAPSHSRAAPALWPTGTTPEPEELAVDEEEIRRLADFGPAPSNWLLTPPYALRVWRRRRALDTSSGEAELALHRAEAARDEALVHLTRQVRSLLAANDRYHSLIRDLEAYERLVQEREAAVNQSDASLHVANTELEVRERALTAERGAQERTRDEARQVVARLEEALGRLEAQHKRTDIERRALLEVARRKLGPGGGDLPADLAAPLADLDAKSDALRPEIERVRAEVHAARSDLGEAERNLELSGLELQRIHSQKTMRLAERQEDLARHSQDLEQARREHRAALAGVGRAVLAMKGHVPVEERVLDELRLLDDRVRLAAREAHRLRLAPLACDADAVRRGWWLLALGAAALGAVPWLL